MLVFQCYNMTTLLPYIRELRHYDIAVFTALQYYNMTTLLRYIMELTT